MGSHHYLLFDFLIWFSTQGRGKMLTCLLRGKKTSESDVSIQLFLIISFVIFCFKWTQLWHWDKMLSMCNAQEYIYIYIYIYMLLFFFSTEREIVIVCVCVIPCSWGRRWGRKVGGEINSSSEHIFWHNLVRPEQGYIRKLRGRKKIVYCEM